MNAVSTPTDREGNLSGRVVDRGPPPPDSHAGARSPRLPSPPASRPPREATIVLELADLGVTIRRGLPHPGPVTVLRGTSSQLLLAVWRRRDRVGHLVTGDRALLEDRPTL